MPFVSILREYKLLVGSVLITIFGPAAVLDFIEYFALQRVVFRSCAPGSVPTTVISTGHQSLYSPPVFSTCPLHTNCGCGKEGRILIVTCQGSTRSQLPS